MGCDEQLSLKTCQIRKLAVALADAMREKFGGDSLEEMQRNYDLYLESIRRY